MDQNHGTPTELIDKDQVESPKLAADGSSKTPVFNDRKLLVKLKISMSRSEEIEEGEIVSPVVKIHRCSECNKTFHSGKALGGHMSTAHVQAGKQYNKKMKVKKSTKFQNHGSTTSGADTDSAAKVCLICAKIFPSRKSLFGHMRCHPDRDWRGMEPPDPMEDKKTSLSMPIFEDDDEDDRSLETVYLDEYLKESAAAMAVTPSAVDLTDSLISWAVTGRRGQKGLEHINSSPKCRTLSGQDKKQLCEGLDLLVNVASGDSLNSSQTQEEEKFQEVEARGSNSPTPTAEIDVVNGINKLRSQRIEVHPAKDGWDFSGTKEIMKSIEIRRNAEIEDLNGFSKSKRQRLEVCSVLDRRDFPVKKLKFSEAKVDAGIEDVNGSSKSKSQRSGQEVYPATKRRGFSMKNLKISERRCRDEEDIIRRVTEKGKGKAPTEPEIAGITYQGNGMARMEPELPVMIYNGKGKAPKELKFTGMAYQGKRKDPIEPEFTGMIYGGKGMALMKPGFTGMICNGKGSGPSESESTKLEDIGYLDDSCSTEKSDSMCTDDQLENQKYSQGNQIKVMVNNKERGENLKKPVNLELPEGDHASPVLAQDGDAATAPTPEKYICSTCHKSFASHQALGGHRSSHNKLRVSIQNAVDESPWKYRANSVSPVSEAAGSKSAEINAYICNICNKDFPTGQALEGHKTCHSTRRKSFPSHQALGGRRSSHNKFSRRSSHNKFRVSIQNAVDEYSPKNHVNSVSSVPEAASTKSADINAYICKIRNKDFPTGQALEGHKRSHWIGSSSQAASSEEDHTCQSTRKVLEFDLNEMPDVEDGDGDGHDSP